VRTRDERTSAIGFDVAGGVLIRSYLVERDQPGGARRRPRCRTANRALLCLERFGGAGWRNVLSTCPVNSLHGHHVSCSSP